MPITPRLTDPNAAAHERVYRSLRQQVMHGEVPPGQPMTLRGVARDFGVSMTPAREAVRRLVAEGALTISSSGRVSTPELSPERIEELAAIRALLEPELASRAHQEHIVPVVAEALRTAGVAKEDLKPTPEWAQALATHVQAGGDPTDDWAILATGCTAGIFKTAAQKQQEAEEAAANQPQPEPQPPVTLPVDPITGLPPATDGTYNLPKQQPFIRATDEESAILEQVLLAAPARLRMIYNGATHINSGDELFATLMAMMAASLEGGETRAAELLAPMTA